ncbi:hypothetical protein FS749_013026 [Ceratobasidium sp. UAMH 11750]|nr:hypothetical protein FS749_013026 [Ceratobasidium sp. UAMH 11750]
MRPSVLIAPLVTMMASTLAVTWNYDVCPPLAGLVPGYINLEGGKCVCRYAAQMDPWPTNPACTTVAKTDRCEWTCPPSPSPGLKAKRNQPILMPDGALSRCPSGMTACPLDAPPSLNGERATATVSIHEPYECIEPEEDLYNCGGCSSTGKGTNCNAMVGVLGTSCTKGKCVIYSCERGYEVAVNEQGAQECVPKPSRHMRFFE